MSTARNDITAVILAGGRGRRMGGQDKGLIKLDGKPLVAILIESLSRQGVDIVINANRSHERYREFGYPLVTDQLADYQGPLAGFASAMATVQSPFILTLPCDGPLLADNYVARFVEARRQNRSSLLVAHDGERLQPVHALLATALLPDLKAFLDSGERKIDRWYARHDYLQVDFSDCVDMFRNINTPTDQAALQTQS